MKEYNRSGYNKCPSCGYWAFDGTECHDCGYTKQREGDQAIITWPPFHLPINFDSDTTTENCM